MSTGLHLRSALLRTAWCTPLPHLPFPPWAAHSNGRLRGKNLLHRGTFLYYGATMWEKGQSGHCPLGAGSRAIVWGPCNPCGPELVGCAGIGGAWHPDRGMYFSVPLVAVGDLVKRTSTAASHIDALAPAWS